MLPLFDKNSAAGLSLAEIMVGVAITGFVSMIALDQFVQLNRGMWINENRAITVQQLERSSNIIRNTLPRFMSSVVGADGETIPNGLWTCGIGPLGVRQCTMSITYNNVVINPIYASCEYISNLALRGSDQQTLFRAHYMDASISGECLSCGPNRAPRLTVVDYEIDGATNLPVEKSRLTMPSNVGDTSEMGVIAMGICVEAKPYQYNHGTPTAANWVNRYDRWAVSLMPVYLARPLKAGLTGRDFISDLAGALSSIPDKLMLAPPRQISPGLIYTPVR